MKNNGVLMFHKRHRGPTVVNEAIIPSQTFYTCSIYILARLSRVRREDCGKRRAHNTRISDIR